MLERARRLTQFELDKFLGDFLENGKQPLFQQLNSTYLTKTLIVFSCGKCKQTLTSKGPWLPAGSPLSEIIRHVYSRTIGKKVILGINKTTSFIEF